MKLLRWYCIWRQQTVPFHQRMSIHECCVYYYFVLSYWDYGYK